MLVAQGNLPAALTAYQASIAIADKLAKADPGNARWQRDVALSHWGVARVMAQRGEQEKALAAFSKAHAIIAKLKSESPSDATLPKDLAWIDAQMKALQK